MQHNNTTTTNNTAGRSRHIAGFAAGIAATIAGGIVFATTVAGAGSIGADEATFVPVEPCRLFDTRSGPDNVGPRSTPLGPDETMVQQVTGTNGNCNIPPEASAIAINATAVGPTAPSYASMFPADAAPPLSSNLNYVPGQAPTPNKVDVKLSADGKLAVYNAFGSVDLLADVTGYYTNSGLQQLSADVDALMSAAQPFTVAAHGDGQTISETSTLVEVQLAVPAPGHVIASGWAEMSAFTTGAMGVCSITTGETTEDDQRLTWQAPGTFLVSNGQVSGTRRFEVAPGLVTIRLVCEHQGPGAQVGNNESELTAIFIPTP